MNPERDKTHPDAESVEVVLKVSASSETTVIRIGPDMLARVGAVLAIATPARRALVVSDETVAPLYARPVLQSLNGAGFNTRLHAIAAGEPSKSLDGTAGVYRALAGHGVGRDGIVIAVGGGVVSDLAGFAAATWMRGIEFAIVPTTLESCVDAAIGGKTGINVDGGKNLVGAFHAPRLVAIDPSCLRTLSDRDLRAGLAESVKHALIADEAFLTWHEDRADAILRRDPAALAELIHRNVRIKASVVGSDFRERSGRRILLNFGHTFGHAVESDARVALRHGECVAMGMAAAGRLSEWLGMMPPPDRARIDAVLDRFGLALHLGGHKPPTGGAPDVDDMMARMTRDKKARSEAVRFVLLNGIGRAVVRSDVPESEVRRACRWLLAR